MTKNSNMCCILITQLNINDRLCIADYVVTELLMYQSIPSMTIPPGKPPGNFLKGRISHPRTQKKCETPTPGAIIFKNLAKKLRKHETEL